jgi:hypothetical protein
MVTDHPKFGKILVARRDLPSSYYIVWWGTKQKYKDVPNAHMEWALQTRTGAGYINARYHQGGSLLQFSACPGPNELTTVWMGPHSESVLRKNEKLAGLLFSTRMEVPKNHHLTMMYGDSPKGTDEFFKDRGLVRGDVGTPKFPALRKEPRVTGCGQHVPTSGRCISTLLNGCPCQGELPITDSVPYCPSCRKTGDPSLGVVDHPKFGKILIARRELPPGYWISWWGARQTSKTLPDKSWEWVLQTPEGLIDARPHQGGSQLQFSACPGPDELTALWMGPNSEALLTGHKKDKLLGCLFTTRMTVPKNYNLTMMYNTSIKTTDDFFAEKGITRANIGTPKYPALRKAGK